MAEPVPASGPRPVESLRNAPKPQGGASLQPSVVLTGWWTVRRVRDALDYNDAGSFAMIHAFRATVTRHPRISGARGQRIATPLGVKRELCLPEGYESEDMRSPAARSRDDVARLFAPGGALDHGMRAYLEAELADFGMGFGVIRWEPTAGGGAVMPIIEPWPLSAVTAEDGTLRALIEGQSEPEPITPGDGRWIAVLASEYEPWREGAMRCIAEPHLSNAQARRDANRLSEAAGQNPVVGTLPETCASESKDERAFRATIDGISTGKQAVLKRVGYEIDRLKSDAAQHVKIFEILWALTDKDAAHAYLGQDGTAETGSTGTYGARKVLDGVRRDLVERDCMALSAAFAQVIRPYCWYNQGRVDLAPVHKFLVPDEAEEARAKQERDEKRAARKAFHEELSSFGDSLTPEIVEALAAEHGVMCSPEMAKALADRSVVQAASKALPMGEGEEAEEDGEEGEARVVGR